MWQTQCSAVHRRKATVHSVRVEQESRMFCALSQPTHQRRTDAGLLEHVPAMVEMMPVCSECDCPVGGSKPYYITHQRRTDAGRLERVPAMMERTLECDYTVGCTKLYHMGICRSRNCEQGNNCTAAPSSHDHSAHTSLWMWAGICFYRLGI